MNKNEIIGAIGMVTSLIDAIVEQEVKKNSVIGKYMVVRNSLNAVSLDTNASANINGILVQIVSEPYAKKVFGGEIEIEVVKVCSMITNREYEVPFSESWIVEVK